MSRFVVIEQACDKFSQETLQQQNRRIGIKKEITNISFVLIFICWNWVTLPTQHT